MTRIAAPSCSRSGQHNAASAPFLLLLGFARREHGWQPDRMKQDTRDNVITQRAARAAQPHREVSVA